jgi:hypothetical protein
VSPRTATRARPLPLSRLAAISRDLARTPSLWRPHAHHPRVGFWPVRLLAAEDHEAWVIGRTPGLAVELHDHGGSATALTVVEGCLHELRPEDGRLRSRVVRRGTTVTLPAGVVHDVVGRAPAPATSIHVHSPPLTRMTYFADDGRPLFTVDVGA